MSCDVCSEVYEQTLRSPLVLPCGHTFCSTCLTIIKKSCCFLCPKCRADHNNVQVEALSVNYSLLNILPHCTGSDQECDKCATHGDELRYWCATCDLPLCRLCIYSGHPQGHTVKLAQTFVEEKKLMLVEKIKVNFKNIEDQKQELKKGFNDLDVRVKQLICRNTHLYDNKAALNDLLAETRKANSISSVKYFEKVVGEFKSKDNLMGLDNEVVAWKAEYSGGTPAKGKNLSTEDKLLLGKSEDLAQAVTGTVKRVPHQWLQQQSFVQLQQAHNVFVPNTRPKISRGIDPLNEFFGQRRRMGGRRGFVAPLRLSRHRHAVRAYQQQQSSDQSQQETIEVPRAVMNYRDGRLLLHTRAEPATTRLSLQVPSEMFLELSVGGRCLGRVYISLWCHLRQAQQFLVLCMGTLGPSLLGTKVSEKVRNVIVFRSAIDRNNQSVPQALLMGLEWAGQYSKTESEGLVTGMAGNNGIAFGICTQGQTNAAMHAPFGKVVAGLEAANEAFQHNPVTEVTITHCGLVLPGLSQ